MRTIIIVLTSLLILSCGSRKTQITKLKAASVAALRYDATINSNVITTTAIDTRTNEEVKTYTPVDPTKPMEIINPDGTKETVNNGKKETRKTTGETKATGKTEATTKADIAADVKQEDTVATYGKGTDKKEYLGWIPLVIFATCFIILFLYARKRNKENENA